MEKYSARKIAQELPEGHPALKRNTHELQRRALEVLSREALTSRLATNNLQPGVRNTELFYRIADQIELFPEAYEQGTWGDDGVDTFTPCGAAFCIAGHAAYETGFIPLTYEFYGETKFNWALLSHPQRPETLSASHIGEAELGLSSRESAFLFHEDWIPRSDLTVSEALRLIGDGALISEVSEDPNDWTDNQGEWNRLLEEEESRTINVTGVYPR